MHARLWVFLPMLLVVSTANGTDIYKCTDKNGATSYGDKPCPSQQITLLHKGTAAEAAQAKQEQTIVALNAMVDSGHLDEARKFAVLNGLSAEFQARVQANISRDQEQRRQEMAKDAEIERANKEAYQARRQQAMQAEQAKLVQADAAQEKFRKDHWTEIKQQNFSDVLSAQSPTFNAARGKWCSVSKEDGSTVCQ